MLLAIRVERRSFQPSELFPIICRVEDPRRLPETIGVGASLQEVSADGTWRAAYAARHDYVMPAPQMPATFLRLFAIPRALSEPSGVALRYDRSLRMHVGLWDGEPGASTHIGSVAVPVNVNQERDERIDRRPELTWLACSSMQWRSAVRLNRSGDWSGAAVLGIEALERAMKARAVVCSSDYDPSDSRKEGHDIDALRFFIPSPLRNALEEAGAGNAGLLGRREQRRLGQWTGLRQALRYPGDNARYPDFGRMLELTEPPRWFDAVGAIIAALQGEVLQSFWQEPPERWECA